MRFSSPITTSRLRSPISPSMHTTLSPMAARATAIFAVVVVLPTAPLPEVMVRTFPVIDQVSASQAVSGSFAARAPALGHDAPVFDARQLRPRFAPVRRRDGDQVRDAQLRGRQLEGAHHGVCV